MSVDPNDFGYAGFRFSWGDHICGIFDDRAQQMEIMGAFVGAGLRAVQRCIWVGPAESGDALRRHLTSIGGDLPTLEASGQLLIISRVDFYLHEGMFDPDRCLELLNTLREDSRRDGYSTMRIVCDASWLRQDHIDPELWESFQLRLTRGISNLPLVMVCQADRQQLSSPLIVVALRTHPIVILGDVIRENPFYIASPPTSATPRDIA